MAKIAFSALLIVLVFFEAYLCATFLPSDWQQTIETNMHDALPITHDWMPITHPVLQQEIEHVVPQPEWARITFAFLTLALLVTNSFLIRWVWLSLRVERTTN
jgi:hypothetical protein